MSNPIVFISQHKIKEGKLDEFRQYYCECTALIETNKPGTVGFLAYLNEAKSEVSIVHLFPNAQAMDDHIQGASDRARGACEFIEPERFEIYGAPSEEVMELLKGIAGTDVKLNVDPVHLGGYMRPESC